MAEREECTEPEAWRRGRRADQPGTSPVEDVARPSDRAEEAALPVEEETDTGPLALDDDFSGDETTRDVGPEREPDPAEETAVHPQDEEPRPE